MTTCKFCKNFVCIPLLPGAGVDLSVKRLLLRNPAYIDYFHYFFYFRKNLPIPFWTRSCGDLIYITGMLLAYRYLHHSQRVRNFFSEVPGTGTVPVSNFEDFWNVSFKEAHHFWWPLRWEALVRDYRIKNAGFQVPVIK